MNVSKCSLVVIALIALEGCTLRPELVAAYVRGSDEAEMVEVTLRSGDAKAIKDREIYFSIVVVDCENSQKQFPMRPYIAEQLASKFDFSTSGYYVTFHGSMPQRLLVDYKKPCVFLRGGSFIFGEIKSAPIQLVRIGS